MRDYTVLPYSGYITGEKTFTNFADLLLCAKISFTKTVSSISAANTKRQAMKIFLAKYTNVSNSLKVSPEK